MPEPVLAVAAVFGGTSRKRHSELRNIDMKVSMLL